jgi:butyrate kinase
MRILAINPGSTSTKFSLYDDLTEVLTRVIRHDIDDLSRYNSILQQYEFRKELILDALKTAKIDVKSIDAVVGRGGLIKPIPGGVYRVNDEMIKDIKLQRLGEHASNLGGILAREIAKEAGHPEEAFIVDPVVVDEMHDIARYSGNCLLPRISIFHALNQKAVARRYAREIGKKYEDLSLIVAHLGGGITVGAHYKGRVIDVNNGLDGDGPFSPERSGTVPVGALAKLCFSEKYDHIRIRKMIIGRGGILSYLGTNSTIEVEDRIAVGDKYAREVYEAMAYQIAKEIGAYATVLKGKVDAILITGGVAYSEMLLDWIRERISFIADIKIYPGEDEMNALVEGVYYAYKGEQEIKEYV